MGIVRRAAMNTDEKLYPEENIVTFGYVNRCMITALYNVFFLVFAELPH